MSRAHTTTPINPMHFEIEPGRRVCDLTTVADAEAAALQIDMDVESIIAQIARAEENPASVLPGWRTRAGSAIRWKKRVRKAKGDRIVQLTPPKPPSSDKRQAILDVVREELGEPAFEILVARAKVRRPDLGWNAS